MIANPKVLGGTLRCNRYTTSRARVLSCSIFGPVNLPCAATVQHLLRLRLWEPRGVNKGTWLAVVRREAVRSMTMECLSAV